MNFKTFIFFTLFVFLSYSINAQIPDLDFSIRGGLNLTTTSGEHSLNAKLKPGIHLGFFGSLPITSQFRLESGLAYSQKGAIFEREIIRQNFNLHYLDLPILARINIAPNLDLLGGPQISYLLASKTTTTSNGLAISHSSLEGLRRVDLGIHLGASYLLLDELSVGLGYDLGLLSHDNEGNFKTFNRVFKISVGYLLN